MTEHAVRYFVDRFLDSTIWRTSNILRDLNAMCPLKVPIDGHSVNIQSFQFLYKRTYYTTMKNFVSSEALNGRVLIFSDHFQKDGLILLISFMYFMAGRITYI